MERETWLKKRRKIAVQRSNELFAPNHDEMRRTISLTHNVMFNRFLEDLPEGPILNAACGSGKHWPLLLQEGREIIGVDRSAAMLENARRKFPEVKTRLLDLEGIDFQEEFAGAVCIDALENMPPELWSQVFSRFFRSLIPGGTLYFTVELLDRSELEKAYKEGKEQGFPLVPGEVISDGGYHFYPQSEQLVRWLENEKWAEEIQEEGDGYMHIMVRRREEE